MKTEPKPSDREVLAGLVERVTYGYTRMYAVFEPMRASIPTGNLSVPQLIEILKAMIHPSQRR